MSLGARSNHQLLDARIGARVEVRRKELGLSRAQAAAALGLTEGDFGARETGHSSFQALEILALATMLGVPPGWFFEGLELNASEGPPDC